MNTSTAMRRTVGGAVAVLVLALAPATAAYAAGSSTIELAASPIEYTPVDVSVSVTSDTDAPTTLELFADGVSVGGAVVGTCDGVALTCDAIVSWLPTTTSQVALTAKAYAGTTELVVDGTRLVTPAAAPPTIAIATAGGTIAAATDIDVTASTGAAQADEPKTLELYRDAVKVATFTCTGGSTCSHTFVSAVPLDKAGASYDFTAKVLTALVSDGSAAREATTATAETFSTPQPTIAITIPANAATIDAPTSPANPTVRVVTATASFLTDKPDKVQLKVGGTNTGSAQTCTSWTANSCTIDLPWTVTSSGSYLLTAEVTTTGLTKKLSGTTTTIVDLPPTVSIMSPTAGATVTGVITIAVSASTDGGATDKPASLQLLVNDVAVGSSVTCAGNLVGNTCTRTLTYDTTGKPTPLTLKVRATTGTGDTGTSAGVQVGVSTPLPQVSITTSFPPSVKGVVSVGVDASTTASTTDFPDFVELYDGASLVGTVDCVNTSHTCSGPVSWDTTLLDGAHSLTARVTTTGSNGNSPVVVTSSPAASVTVATPAALVSITTTFANPTIGPVDVTVSASTDAATTQYPSSVALYDDGVLVGSASCSGISRGCTRTITWDATGLTGDHDLTAVVTTTAGGNGAPAAAPVTSSVKTVTVSTPAPNVSVTVSPISGTTIKGTVTISVTASLDTALTDHPTSITLTTAGLGGSITEAATQSCPAPPQSSCTLTWTWDATGVSGGRTVTATAAFEKAASTPGSTDVTVSSPAPTVTIDSAFDNPTIGVKTVAVSAATDSALSDYPATIVLKDGGTPVGAPVQCSGTTSTCSGTVDWDTTGFSGDRTLTATVTTTNGVTQDTALPVTVTVQTPGTDVVVGVTPISGSTIKGVVTISVTASSNPSLTNRAPASITLTKSGLGGTITGADTQPCPAPLQSTCTRTWTWDTTGQNGARTVSARATLESTATVTSSKPVTIANPLPTVAFSSPSNGTVITKTTTIKVTASTDATTTDFPKTLQLLVNGVVKSSKACTTTAHSCTGSFGWSPGTLDGPQAFTARITTTKGAVRTTAPRTYYAYYRTTSSSTSVASLTTVVSGTRITVKGKVISTKTNAGVGGITVRITRDPAIGTTASTNVVTSSSGAFSFSFTARNNTVVTARALSKSYNGTTWFSGSSRTLRQQVRALTTCTIVDTTLKKGQIGKGSCLVPGLPVGTPLTLTYSIGGRTTTLASGRSKSETIAFSFVFPSPGTYTLKVNLSANAVYAATSTPGFAVTQA